MILAEDITSLEDEIKDFFLREYCEKYAHKMSYCKNTIDCQCHQEKWQRVREATPANRVLQEAAAKKFFMAHNNAICFLCGLPCFRDHYLNNTTTVEPKLFSLSRSLKRVYKDTPEVYLVHQFCLQVQSCGNPRQHPHFYVNVLEPLLKCKQEILTNGNKYEDIDWISEWKSLKANLINSNCLLEKGLRKNSRWRRKRVQQLLDRDGELCAFCKKRLGSDITVDHIKPISENGSNDLANLRLMHNRCNSSLSVNKNLYSVLQEICHWPKMTEPVLIKIVNEYKTLNAKNIIEQCHKKKSRLKSKYNKMQSNRRKAIALEVIQNLKIVIQECQLILTVAA